MEAHRFQNTSSNTGKITVSYEALSDPCSHDRNRACRLLTAASDAHGTRLIRSRQTVTNAVNLTTARDRILAFEHACVFSAFHSNLPLAAGTAHRLHEKEVETSSQLSTTLSNLRPGSNYIVRVAAVNAVGSGHHSDSIRFRTSDESENRILAFENDSFAFYSSSCCVIHQALFTNARFLSELIQNSIAPRNRTVRAADRRCGRAEGTYSNTRPLEGAPQGSMERRHQEILYRIPTREFQQQFHLSECGGFRTPGGRTPLERVEEGNRVQHRGVG